MKGAIYHIHSKTIGKVGGSAKKLRAGFPPPLEAVNLTSRINDLAIKLESPHMKSSLLPM